MEKISGELLMNAIRKIPELNRAVIGGRVHPNILQSLINGDEVEVKKILTLSALAAKKNPSQGRFNELVNEVPVWELLDQIDGLSSGQRQKLQPFLEKLWADEQKESKIGYPKGFQIKTPEEQLEI